LWLTKVDVKIVGARHSHTLGWLQVDDRLNGDGTGMPNDNCLLSCKIFWVDEEGAWLL
jgi:hypothetical protein